jgi:excisionase family DNA binding protein
MSDSFIVGEIVKALQPIVEKAVKTAVAEAVAEKSPPESIPRLLSVDEAAERLSIHAVSVRRLIAKGQLKGIRVLGALRIDQRDLDSFIEGRRHGRES